MHYPKKPGSICTIAALCLYNIHRENLVFRNSLCCKKLQEISEVFYLIRKSLGGLHKGLLMGASTNIRGKHYLVLSLFLINCSVQFALKNISIINLSVAVNIYNFFFLHYFQTLKKRPTSIIIWEGTHIMTSDQFPDGI